jgi:hypothetical protein
MTKRSIELTDEQFLTALKKMRDKVAKEDRPMGLDSDMTGSKHTECGWGMCVDDPEFWTDPDTLLWPDQPPLDTGYVIDDKRIYSARAKYRADHHRCPYDNRRPGYTSGCFYKCRFFRPPRGKQPPTKEETLRLYDDAIAKFEKRTMTCDRCTHVRHLPDQTLCNATNNAIRTTGSPAPSWCPYKTGHV